MRYFISCIIIGCCLAKATAQETLNGILKNKHPFYTTQSLFLTNEILPNSYAEATLTGFFGENNNTHPFMPKNYHGVQFYSEGLKKIKKYTLYGNIRFNEQYNNGVLGKNIFETAYLSPYYLSDTLQKDWKWQTITATAQLSRNISKKINTELAVSYTGQHKVNYQFPKPLLYKNSIAVRPQIGYTFTKNHKISIGYTYKNSNTDSSIDDGTVSQIQLFSITGLGNLTNNNGAGSNYRFEKENANTISLQGIHTLGKINFNYQFSVEKMEQEGFDDNLKKVAVFNYNEWISKAVSQISINTIRNRYFIHYKLMYQDGKGTHIQPRENSTYTEKLSQELAFLLHQKEKYQTIGLTLTHTHQKEANSSFANLYDIDYLKVMASYQKQFFIQQKKLSIAAKIGYQTPTYKYNRFVKTNHFISNYILPLTEFYDQDFCIIQVSPQLLFPVKAIQNDVSIGINTHFTIANKINFYNGLFVKANF